MKAFVSKFLMLAALAAVLGIAIAMVRGVMEDRGRYREETLRTVSHSLAGPPGAGRRAVDRAVHRALGRG